MSENLARLLRPLRVRDFRLLWGGQTVSLLGDGILTVALAWQTVELSSNPAALSAVLLARGLPEVGLAPVGGAVTDRLPRRTVMLVSDTVRMVAVSTIAVLAGTGHIEVWHLIVAGLAYGSAEAFFEPAVYSIYPEILSPELLLEATALRSTGAILAIMLLGPAFGGIVVGTLGTAWAFGADAVTFGVSLATLLAVSVRAAPHREQAQASVLSDVRDGFRYVRAVRWLWISMAMTAVSNMFLAGPLRVAVPVFVKTTLHEGAGSLGIASGALGAGGLLALVVVTRFGRGPRRTAAMYVGWIAAGVAMAAGAVFPTLAAITLAMAGAGLGLMFGNTIWLTLVQELVPKNVMGRVFSVDTVVSQGLIPVSIAMSGALVGWVGPGATLVIGGLASSAMLVLAATRPGALTATA